MSKERYNEYTEKMKELNKEFKQILEEAEQLSQVIMNTKEDSQRLMAYLDKKAAEKNIDKNDALDSVYNFCVLVGEKEKFQDVAKNYLLIEELEPKLESLDKQSDLIGKELERLDALRDEEEKLIKKRERNEEFNMGINCIGVSTAMAPLCASGLQLLSFKTAVCITAVVSVGTIVTNFVLQNNQANTHQIN